MTQFLWFLLPTVIELVSGCEIPQTRYNNGLLAVLQFHAVFVDYQLLPEKKGRVTGDSHWSFYRYFLPLIAGGIALFIPGPRIVSRVFHCDFAASFLI
jgi:hypothetical protein